ncbi:MAG TPA: MFS transporter [Acidobacteriota bacterium]|nr:MFS transporter [Acidobacteriota bacterium]
MTRTDFYGWKILAALWIIVFINLAFPIYGSSVINAAMMEDLNLDRQTLGLLFSLFTILSGLPGPLVALCVGRYGVRLTLTAGSVLVVLGAVLMATVVKSGLLAAFAFGIIVGSGVAAGGMIAAQAGLANWFVRRRALALSVISTATGVGGFVASPLLNRIIEAAGGNWRMGWWVIALLACCAAAVALMFIRNRPADLGQVPDGEAASEKPDAAENIRKRRAAVHITAREWSSREALSGLSYWVMMFCHLSLSCGYTVFLAHGVVHLQDLGHSRDMAAWAPSFMAFAGLFAKIIVGIFGDRIEPRYLWAVFIASLGVGTWFMVSADTTATLLAAAGLVGIGFGGGVVCLAAVISNYYGIKPFAVLIGISVAVNTTIGAIAPAVAGRLYDAGYGYTAVFHTIMVWCLLGAVLLFFLKPPFMNTKEKP